MNTITTITAVITVIIAACVAYISWLQYKIVKTKLRLTLYEKRLEIYSVIEDICLGIEGGRFLNEDAFSEQRDKFTKMKREAQFLFSKNKRMSILLKSLSQALIDFERCRRELSANKIEGDLEKQKQLAQREAELKVFFVDLLRNKFLSQIKPYLSFK